MQVDRPRRFRWIALLIVAVLLAGGAWAFMGAATFLASPARAAVRADAAFVLGGDSGERVVRAAALHRDGLAGVFVLTGAEDMADEVLPAYLYWRAAVLVRAGVPETAVLMDSASSNSGEEAAFGLRLAKSRGWKRVLVVSDPPHMRRLVLLWGRAFAGSGVEVVLVASRPRWWEPDRWWASRRSAQFVIMEYIKLAYTLFGTVL
ncbi:MAG: YdcF family protein [Lysobacter sp.]|nr:YdcF family protein [Lysobacter sp.]